LVMSFAVAWPKLLGDFDLRARYAGSVAMVRYFAIFPWSAPRRRFFLCESLCDDGTAGRAVGRCRGRQGRACRAGPFSREQAARAAVRATPRVISVPAAQAASSCRTRSGCPRSIGPESGAGRRRGRLGIPQRGPPTRHADGRERPVPVRVVLIESMQVGARQKISGTSWPPTVDEVLENAEAGTPSTEQF